MPKKKKEPSDKVKQLLASVADHFDQEDRDIREKQIRTWRKLKMYWNNYTNIWYDEVAHDWKTNEGQQNSDQDMSYYDKPINIFRAYLESIISALSVTVPSIVCYPDDATNPLDLSTAKAGDRIAELVYKHNDVILLWIHALYIFCTEGMVACYNYPKSDKKYGTYDDKKFDEETVYKFICPQCKAQLDEALFAQQQQAQQGMNGTPQEGMPPQEPVEVPVNPDDILGEMETLTSMESDEFMPDDDDILLHDAILNQNEIICPECAMMLDPSMEKSPLIITRLVGVTKKAKTRQCLEAYGGLNVKIPNYARTSADMPYLRFSQELHYSKVIEMYDHLADKAKRESGKGLTGMYDPYETWGRLPPLYNGEFPINNTTVNMYWFRSWAFNVLNPEDADLLKKEYPDGCRYVKVNECFAEAENEALDDCWTVTHNPLSDQIQHDPLGLLLTTIQDITNEMVSLILQTIEHGIPQGFADPSVLNFDQYRQTEVAPGSIFPAANKSGRSMSEFFHEIKTATLSEEVMPFAQQIQQFGQLVVGAQPSIFGGELAGSKTASEYSQSRAQALQRLQTPWKMLTAWWKQIFGKVIPSYIKTVVEDEHAVEKEDNGNFINVYVRKAELNGKIGNIELEGAENLPQTWMQQKDVIMNLMQANNPLLMEALLHPQNLPSLKRAIGLNEFVIPGEDDREKEFEEIQLLLNSEPIVSPPDEAQVQEAMMAGMDPNTLPPNEQPSVEVDPDVDNHKIGQEIDRAWLVSAAGRLAKTKQPKGYRNVLLHLKAHKEAEQMLMMQEMQMQLQQQMESDAALGKTGKPDNAAAAGPKKTQEANGERATVQ